MGAADERDSYKPIYIVELYLPSGLYVFATRDVELIESAEQSGYNIGGYNIGGYNK